MSTKREFVFKISKGFRGRPRNNWVLARRAVVKSLEHQTRSRKLIKRDLRKQWIMQINAATRQFGLSYKQFIQGLGKSNILLNRKMLAELCVYEPFCFSELVNHAKRMVSWKNLDANRMNLEDVARIQKFYEPIPPEYDERDPVNKDNIRSILESRIKEQFSHAQKKADAINAQLIKVGKVVPPVKLKDKRKVGKNRLPKFRKTGIKRRAAYIRRLAKKGLKPKWKKFNAAGDPAKIVPTASSGKRVEKKKTEKEKKRDRE